MGSTRSGPCLRSALTSRFCELPAEPRIFHEVGDRYSSEWLMAHFAEISAYAVSLTTNDRTKLSHGGYPFFSRRCPRNTGELIVPTSSLFKVLIVFWL